MKFICYFILIYPFAPVVSAASGFSIFGAMNVIAAGVSNFTSVVQEIFVGHNNTQTVQEKYLTIEEVATKYGYVIANHNVFTKDGYELNIKRLSKKKDVKQGPVILLMHGIIDSSDCWMLQGPNKSLAYVLVDAGFDVWMGNARGNKHSLKHLNLGVNETNYWKFSWEQIGVYDLPATIDYILNVTNREELYYIGHSQGTTSFYVMASLKPEYNDKVKTMFSLAPVAFMSHVRSPIVKLFSPAHKILSALISNLNSISPSTDSYNEMMAFVCRFVTNCENMYSLIIGNDNKLINEDLLQVIYSHTTSVASTLQFMHYGQLVENGRFCRYDYGESLNLVKYGQAEPPDYDLSNVWVPIVMYYSDNDWLSDVKDVETLRDSLMDVEGFHYMKDFNHLDYLYADVAIELIYIKIVKQIEDLEINISLSNMVN